MRATRLEVSIPSFLSNVKKIREYTNKEVMPVVKANAYGTYLNERMDVLNQFSIVAVALVDEGVKIRSLGFQGDIFVLNQPSIDEIDLIEEKQLSIGISDLSFLEECIYKKATFPVHLEIETGMNRTGIFLSDLEHFLELLSTSSLKVDGIYSHFSSADFDEDYSKMQIKKFEDALDFCECRGFTFRYIHISASNGLLNYPIPFTNLVRPGILLYGYEPFPGSNSLIPVEPVCRLVSKITFLKTVSKNEKIGYSQKYTCIKDTKVATIPIGYGDGYRRCLSNKGYVFINDKKAPIIGNVCMDSIMVDVSHISCSVGDEVILMDSTHISLDEIAVLCNTINYEILCTIGERVPRVFIGGDYE